MDDLTLLALGRAFVTNSVEKEQIIRRLMEVQAKLDEATKPKETASPSKL